MTIISNSVVFNLPSPDRDAIISKVGSVSGLNVIFEDNASDDLYELNLSIAFSADPNNAVTVYSYKAGAVVNSVVEEIDNEHEKYIPVLLKGLEGADEKKGQQSIYVTTYLGCELTLFDASIVALQSLNGEIKNLVDLESIKSRFPMTEAQLMKNIKKHQWMRLAKLVVQLILLPITLLVMAYGMVKFIFKLPFDIHKIRKQISSIDKK